MTVDEIKSHKEYRTKEYVEHGVFSILIELKEFYESLSESVVGFHSAGTTPKGYNIDKYIYASIKGILDSIYTVLKNGRISDAFSLIRKYHDTAVIDIYKAIYAKINQGIGIEDWIVKEIDEWANDKGSFPRYENMMDYIKKYDKLKDLCSYFDFDKDGEYATIRRLCNDYNHANSLYYIMMNDNDTYNQNRIIELDRISNCIKSIFFLHFSYCVSINPHYIMASDFIDALECGRDPEKGSECWVAPFAQAIFDKYIKAYKPELATYILKTNPMHFD